MDLKYSDLSPPQAYYPMFTNVLESNQTENFHELMSQPEVCVESLERQFMSLEETDTPFFNQYGPSNQHSESLLCATGAVSVSDSNSNTALRTFGPLQENSDSVWNYSDTYSLANEIDSLSTICGNDDGKTETLNMPVGMHASQNIEDVSYKKNQNVYNNSALDTVVFQSDVFIPNSNVACTDLNLTHDIGLVKNSLEFPTFDDLNMDNPLTESLEELLFGEEHVLTLDNIDENSAALYKNNSLDGVNSIKDSNLQTYQNGVYDVPFNFNKTPQNNENVLKESNETLFANVGNSVSQSISDFFDENQRVFQSCDNNEIMNKSDNIDDLVNQTICDVENTFNKNKCDTLLLINDMLTTSTNKAVYQTNQDSLFQKHSLQITNNISEVVKGNNNENLLLPKNSVDKFAKSYVTAEINNETCCINELEIESHQRNKTTVKLKNNEDKKMTVNEENCGNSGKNILVNVSGKYLCLQPTNEKLVNDMNSRKKTLHMFHDLKKKILAVHDKIEPAFQIREFREMANIGNKKATIQNNALKDMTYIAREKVTVQKQHYVNERQINSNSESPKSNIYPRLRYQANQLSALNASKNSGSQCEETNSKGNSKKRDISNSKSFSLFDLKHKELRKKEIQQNVTSDVPSGPPVSGVAVKQRCSQCGIFLTHPKLHGHVCDSNNSHLCGLCNEILIGDYSLFTHLLSHKEETVYECDYCGKPFCDFNNFSNHISKHAGTGVYSCDFCTKEYIQNSDISAHLLTHSIEPSYKCNACEKSFSVQSVFLEHKQIHQQFLCHVCGVFIVGKKIFCSHLKSHVNETSLQSTDKSISLDIGYAFTKQNLGFSTLKDYLGFENDVETMSYLCEICGRLFLGQTSFLRHIFSHNDIFIDTLLSPSMLNSSKNQHYQKFISEKFNASAECVVVQNINNQTNGFKNCLYCNKSFKTLRNLKRHISLHKDEKRFICNVCDKSFARSDQLSVHSVTHTGEKQYKCVMCQKTYAHCSGLNSHLKSHRVNNQFECKTCKRCFRNKTKLDYHISSHTGKQPYKCKICGKGFAWLSNCYTHQATHSDTNVYSCELCNKTFSTKKTLQHICLRLIFISRQRKLKIIKLN